MSVQTEVDRFSIDVPHAAQRYIFRQVVAARFPWQVFGFGPLGPPFMGMLIRIRLLRSCRSYCKGKRHCDHPGQQDFRHLFHCLCHNIHLSIESTFTI